MAKRITDLTESPTKDLSVFLEIDKSGYAETKGQTLETILRSRVELTANSSASSYDLSFSQTEQINLTLSASGTVALTIKNTPTDAMMFLNVTKPSATLLSISQYATSGANIEHGPMVGFTELKYAIVTQNGIASVFRLDKYHSSSLVTGKFTASQGFVKTSFDHCGLYVNGNICNFHMTIGITPLSSLSDYYVMTIADFPFNIKNSSAIVSVCYETTARFFGIGRLSNTSLDLQMFDFPGTEEEYLTTITGSFIIE